MNYQIGFVIRSRYDGLGHGRLYVGSKLQYARFNNAVVFKTYDEAFEHTVRDCEVIRRVYRSYSGRWRLCQ